jgi:hypothetical protein
MEGIDEHTDGHQLLEESSISGKLIHLIGSYFIVFVAGNCESSICFRYEGEIWELQTPNNSLYRIVPNLKAIDGPLPR